MMARLLLLIAMLLAPALSATRAGASNCAVDAYDHNGSLMEVQVCDGGRLTISYARPRKGLIRHGVRNGTLLFDGVERPNGVISGQARIFNRRCGEIAYAVSGSDRGGAITLRGDAPVRNKSCRVTRHRPDTLVFTRQAAAPEVVRPSCPPGFVLSRGQCVRAGSPAPAPPPPPAAGGDWYAIAGSFRGRGPAQARARQLGPDWSVMNTGRCPNFRNGFWIATAGPFAKGRARSYAAGAGRGAYVKTCH